MSAKEEQLTGESITFFTAARENTGKAMCDSGDYYGRHYDRPVEDPNGPAITLETSSVNPTEIMASLSTPHYLEANFKILRDLQIKFDAWAKEHPDDSWFEAGEGFMESLGYVRETVGNTYNGENDLTQMLDYRVWRPGNTRDNSDNGIYAAEGVVTIIHIHCGCDVRSGYSRPLFCKGCSDYAFPADVVVGFSAYKGTKGRKELTSEELQKIDETWQIGYSNLPVYELGKKIEKIFWVKEDRVKFKLKTGETIEAQAYMGGDR